MQILGSETRPDGLIYTSTDVSRSARRQQGRVEEKHAASLPGKFNRQSARSGSKVRHCVCVRKKKLAKEVRQGKAFGVQNIPVQARFAPLLEWGGVLLRYEEQIAGINYC